MEHIFELKPTDSHKSFYGKCYYKKYDDMEEIDLFSYDSWIMRYYPEDNVYKREYYLDPSSTTLRHIVAFTLAMNGERVNKKDFLALEYRKDYEAKKYGTSFDFSLLDDAPAPSTKKERKAKEILSETITDLNTRLFFAYQNFNERPEGKKVLKNTTTLLKNLLCDISELFRNSRSYEDILRETRVKIEKSENELFKIRKKASNYDYDFLWDIIIDAKFDSGIMQ